MSKKEGKDGEVPALIDSEVSAKEFRKDWARLIQKIYNINPLFMPQMPGHNAPLKYH